MTSFLHKYSDTEKLGANEKNKQWQREFLMDRLRSHHPQHKLNYPELSKAVRMGMLEKRYALDAVEKSNLQKCLDSMQHCIKVTTRQGLVERLESLSRQLGLKFMEDSSGLFISSDMFFLEIILDSNGMLTDVKVHHECKIEQQSCSELVTCLLKGDFADFTNQLEGLSSIYQLNAEPKVKSKAFVALQAVETDLHNLFKWKNTNNNMSTLLRESPVGIVQKRRGGHPMKLTYFISSYDLLSLKSKTMLPLTMELLKTKDIGMNVSVHLEASSANKLQILPSVTFSKDNNLPIYSPLSQNNSTLLPATFVLRLNEPLPVCDSLLSALGHIEEPGTVSESILHLTIQVASKDQIKKSSKELYVSLPDQNHCYFFTENKNMHGYIITSVPFTEPSQVPKMLCALKQQALFYTFLASCIRADGKLCNIANTTMLEVNAISLHKISVALQHSNEDSLVSVEFEFKDITSINVKLFSVTCSTNYEIYNQKLTKIAAVSLSIPLTIRYLLKLWEKEQNQSFLNHCNTENGKIDLNSSNSDPHVSNNRSGNRCVNFRDTKIKYEKNNGNISENNTTSDNLFSRPTFFNSPQVPIASSDLFAETNLLNASSSNLIVNQFGIKAEPLKDFSSSSMQQEDFCKSPKSKIPVNSKSNLETNDLNSLGEKNHLQTRNFHTSNLKMISSSSVTMENVSNLKNKINLKNKKLELREKNLMEYKNTVSIAPVLSNILANNTSKDNTNGEQINSHDKRLKIEITPIVPNIAIPPMSVNHCTTSKQQTSVKKKSEENQLHKIDKKRIRKDNSCVSRDKIGIKIIELTDSFLTVENMRLNPSKERINSNTNEKNTWSNITKHKSVICLGSSLSGKPNLTTLKTATNLSKPIALSSKLQKRKSEGEYVQEKITPFSESIKNELNNIESNKIEFTNGIPVRNADTKNIFPFKIRQNGNLITAINKLKEGKSSDSDLDCIDQQKIGNLLQNRSNKNEHATDSKYMIQPSVNGMKVTINKTRPVETTKWEIIQNNQLQKEFPSSLNICSSRAHSPNKKHTGLKPGVSSGPASKSKISTFNINSTDCSLAKHVQNKITFYKSHSSECLPINKDQPGRTTANMAKSLSKSSSNLNSSAPLENIFGKEKNSIKKLNLPKTPEKYVNTARVNSLGDNTKNLHPQISPKVKSAMEGLIKTLNTNFQIPKLSAKLSKTDQIPQNKHDNLGNNTSPTSLFSLNGINNYIKQIDHTNPSIVISEIPQIKNFCNVSKSKHNIEKSEKEYFNNNNKLHYSIFSDNSKDIKITKSKKQPNYISELNLKATTDKKKNISVSIQSNKTNETILSNNNSIKNNYPQSLLMHIIKTPVSPPTSLLTSLANATCIETDLMDEALIRIESK